VWRRSAAPPPQRWVTDYPVTQLGELGACCGWALAAPRVRVGHLKAAGALRVPCLTLTLNPNPNPNPNLKAACLLQVPCGCHA